VVLFFKSRSQTALYDTCAYLIFVVIKQHREPNLSTDGSREAEKTARRLRRKRNLVQRDSWGKTRSGPHSDRSKFKRKSKYPPLRDHQDTQ
jgi:hypothetical protein